MWPLRWLCMTRMPRAGEREIGPVAFSLASQVKMCRWRACCNDRQHKGLRQTPQSASLVHMEVTKVQADRTSTPSEGVCVCIFPSSTDGTPQPRRKTERAHETSNSARQSDMPRERSRSSTIRMTIKVLSHRHRRGSATLQVQGRGGEGLTRRQSPSCEAQYRRTGQEMYF